jgi:hypothetical protein
MAQSLLLAVVLVLALVVVDVDVELVAAVAVLDDGDEVDEVVADGDNELLMLETYLPLARFINVSSLLVVLLFRECPSAEGGSMLNDC